MTEAQYQSRLIKKYEAEGFYVIKLIQANRSGLPDLLCLKPDKVLFIEVKGPKGRLSKVQEYRIAELQGRGFDVQVLTATI